VWEEAARETGPGPHLAMFDILNIVGFKSHRRLLEYSQQAIKYLILTRSLILLSVERKSK
jgi:hypothetical protein